MIMNILVLSDIHGNYPALQAVDRFFTTIRFDTIINCGDSLVYAPFPNETLNWLRDKGTLSILGNTDKKVLRLIRGKGIKKPSDPEKRIMYTWTAAHLSADSATFLASLNKKAVYTNPNNSSTSAGLDIGIFHGSPQRAHEFLFDTTPQQHFQYLARKFPQYHIILTGHSHTPYHKKIASTHFINPGSVGRMFDGDPRASCCVITCRENSVTVTHHRIEYDIQQTIEGIKRHNLPEIYCSMYKLGRKTN